MKLEKYTWNNGTKNSPIVLTNEQIKKLIAIGQKEDIETSVSGYITTSSRKMQKFLKYALEKQFENLNIICDEELADVFSINLSTNVIKEGTKELISISTDTGITHDFLKWKYDFSNFVIDGDISEDNIKNRIRVEDGYLVVDDPKENASWSVQLTLTAYPSYYSEEDIANIPSSSKPDIILTISAKKIEDITVSVKDDIPINSQIEIAVSPVPTDSTKLKGATYSYSTTTPEIVSINTTTQGTTIIAKKQGSANLVVTLHACNNTITKSSTISFNVYDLRPMVFIIDQRYLNNLSDPVTMVSENCILNSDGSLQSISNNAAEGNVNNNTLTWIRQNSHAYVSRYLGFSGLRLKQLDDTDRTKFADGTSAAAYISNESGEFDVWLKFASDIYYKTEAYTPKNQSSPNKDYVKVTIARELPVGENENNWCKWSKYKLVAIYEACQINNKLYSLSGKTPINNISQTNSIARAKSRGINFNICDYDMTKLFAFLFYGYYSSLGCQQICGYGTKNDISGVCYPKVTGLTDKLAMTDTTTITGNGAESPDEDQIKAGIGDDIKSVNFWGIENCWGDLAEWLSNLQVMEAFRTESITTSNAALYVADYLDEYNSIVITQQTGEDKTYNSKSEFLQDYTTAGSRFLSITDSNRNIIRLIDCGITQNTGGYIKQMMFGSHADIIAKNYQGGTDTGFCDYGGVDSAGDVARRSHYSADPGGGVGYLHAWYAAGGASSKIGTRLLYNGDASTVYIIDDATETL